MGEVLQLPQARGVSAMFEGAFGICCSCHTVGNYKLASVHCRFTGERPATIGVNVRPEANVVIKKMHDFSERGEVVFMVATDPPLNHMHLYRSLHDDGSEDVMIVLTEELALKLTGDLHKVLEWDGRVKTPWCLFTAG